MSPAGVYAIDAGGGNGFPSRAVSFLPQSFSPRAIVLGLNDGV